MEENALNPEVLDRLYELCIHDDLGVRQQGVELASIVRDAPGVEMTLRLAACVRLQRNLERTRKSIQHAFARSVLLCSSNTMQRLQAAHSDEALRSCRAVREIQSFLTRRYMRRIRWWIPVCDDAVIEHGYCVSSRARLGPGDHRIRWADYTFHCALVRFTQKYKSLPQPTPIVASMRAGDPTLWSPRADALIEHLGENLFEQTSRRAVLK